MSNVRIPSFQTLGVNVAAVQIFDVIDQMKRWIEEKSYKHFIAVSNTHVITESYLNPDFKKILNSADYVVPDGMPLVWLGRLSGYPLKRRVYGPELMETFLKVTGEKYRHFIYGGKPEIAERLCENLAEEIPGINFVGRYSPPFRPLTPEEDKEVVEIINNAKPDILWVGLGAPKQERWMYEHRDKLKVPVMLGVGAAFDFLAGATSQAPVLFRENGFEWLWRLISEPRRLWRRYLVYGPLFVGLVMLEKLKVLKFDQ